jgi:C1A family cysteine protease
MKTISIIGMLAVVASLYIMNMDTHEYSEFASFMAVHQKSYNTEDEYNYRRAIFEMNLDLIETENSKGHSYTLGINQFADWTLEEFKAILGYRQMSDHSNLSVTGTRVPKSDENIDWTVDGAVGPVQNQGSCGSCWAFSAVAALEGAYQIQKGELLKFSEQQLVDCDNNSSGCAGGEMFLAFEFYYQENGTCLESDYGYKAKDGKCKADKWKTTYGPTSDYNLVEHNDPSEIHTELMKAPHSLGIAAGNTIWMFYKWGVVSVKDEGTCGHSLDHGVLLSGYHASSDAWEIRNSWGTSWGENGYIRIEDNHKKESYGVCGVNMEISRPIF